MIYQTYPWGGGYTKSEVDTLLNGKADTSHTHTKSQITDFPTIPTKTSDLTNDSNFIASAIKEGSLSNSGWCLLHGDLLIQWGSTVFNGHGTFNFSKPFYEKPYVIMNYGDTSAYDSPCTIENGLATNTYFSARQYNLVGGWRCNWIAIGKKGY